MIISRVVQLFMYPPTSYKRKYVETGNYVGHGEIQRASGAAAPPSSARTMVRSDISGRVLVDDAAGASAPPSSARTMVRSDVSGRVPVDDVAGAGGRVRVLVDDAAGSRVRVLVDG